MPNRVRHWAKFIKPEELKEACGKAGMQTKEPVWFENSVIHTIIPEPKMAYMIMAVKK